MTSMKEGQTLDAKECNLFLQFVDVDAQKHNFVLKCVVL